MTTIRTFHTYLILGLVPWLFVGICHAQLTAPNYGWPVRTDQTDNPNHRGRIAGTPFEWRNQYAGGGPLINSDTYADGTFANRPNTDPRYHNGVDISSKNGSRQVYTIENGPQTIDMDDINIANNNPFNHRLRVNDAIYFHTTPLATILDGTGNIVNQNDQIGTYDQGGAHVHLMPRLGIIEGEDNYLIYKLPDYENNVIPEVNTNRRRTENVNYQATLASRYFPNGTTGSFSFGNNREDWLFGRIGGHNNGVHLVNIPNTPHEYCVIYDKVDIAVETHENRTGVNGDGYDNRVIGNIGINQLQWDIYRNQLQDGTWELGQEVVNPLIFHDFSSYPPAESSEDVFLSELRVGLWILSYTLTSHIHQTPYDRFWNTRENVNIQETWDLANRGELDVRYHGISKFPDGPYTLRYRASALDTDGPFQLDWSDYKEDHLLLDNFRPMIEGVRVESGELTNTLFGLKPLLGYQAKWDWAQNQPELFTYDEIGPTFSTGERGFQSTISIDFPIKIDVYTSEPVPNLEISDIHAEGSASDISISPVGIQDPDNALHWTFFIDANSLNATHIGRHFLEFSGTDLNGNPLMGTNRTNQSAYVLDPNQIPHKRRVNNQGAFQPNWATNVDRMHGFDLGEFCTTGNKNNSNCLDFDITIASPQGSNNYVQTNGTPIQFAVSFLNNNLGQPPYTYSWSLDDGLNSANSSPTQSYTNPGWKTISLTIEDANGLRRTITKPRMLNIYNPNNIQPLAADFAVSTNRINLGGAVQIQDLSTGGIPPYQYTWSLSNGNPSSSSDRNPQVTYSSSGSKTIALTIRDAQNQTATSSQVITVSNPSVTASLSYSLNQSILSGSFSLTASGGSGFYTYDWNFGDGQIENNSIFDQITHQYNAAGTYTVSVTVRDLLDPSVFVRRTASIQLFGGFSVDIVALGSGPILTGQTRAIEARVSPPAPSGWHYEYKWAFNGGNFPLTSSPSNNTSYSFSGNTSHVIGVNVRLLNNSASGPDCNSTFGGLNCNQIAFETFNDISCQSAGNLPKPLLFEERGGFLRTASDNSTATLRSSVPPFKPGKNSHPVKFWHYPLLPNCGRLIDLPIATFNWFPEFDADRRDYTYDFDIIEINQNGTGLRNIGVAPPNQIPDLRQIRKDNVVDDYPVVGYVLAEWDEFLADNGEELYYGRVTITENGCNNSITVTQPICINVACFSNGTDCDNGDMLWPFHLPRGCRNRRTPKVENGNTTQFPTTSFVTNTVVNNFNNSNVPLIFGKRLETSSSVLLDDNHNINFKAQDEVVLKDGFVARATQFTAKIINELCEFDPAIFRTPDPLPKAPFGFEVTPNPTQTGTYLNLTFQAEQDQSFLIRLMNIQGKEVIKKTYAAFAGENKVRIELPVLSEGIYTIYLSNDKEMSRKKVIIR